MCDEYGNKINFKWCLYCKELIEDGTPFITEIINGETRYYHRECYDLEFPREDSELNFNR